MSGHFTVLVEVKEIIEARPIEDSRGSVVRQGVGNSSPVMQERQVIDRLRVVVSADNQSEAIEKAQRMLTAGHPDVAVVTSDQHYIRPVRDNPQA